MKKIPMRKCVATNEQLPKKELLRIVRTKDEGVKVDSSGRVNGKGAYIKKDSQALELAIKKNALKKALETDISEEVIESIRQAIIG